MRLEIFAFFQGLFSYLYLVHLLIMIRFAGPWCLSIILVMAYCSDNTNMLMRKVGLLVTPSDWAIFNSMARFPYKSKFCQIYMHRPDGLQKILISKTFYDEQTSGLPVWSPCQEILPVNESVELVKFSMDLTGFQCRKPCEEERRRGSISEDEWGKGQTWSEESTSATNCVHMQNGLVHTRPTWQTYKDRVFITRFWNISLKWAI